jgi:hypothetical protein
MPIMTSRRNVLFRWLPIMTSWRKDMLRYARTHFWQCLLRNLSVSYCVNQLFLQLFLICGTHGIYIINWTLRMSNNIPKIVQILDDAHILCTTVRENRIICCQIFCDLLLKSAVERIFNVMRLILIKIKLHIKWKYLI